MFFNTALMIFALDRAVRLLFIIYNTFSIIVAQRIREMALLRAIGASGRQVLARCSASRSSSGSRVGVRPRFGDRRWRRAEGAARRVGIDIPAGGTVISAAHDHRRPARRHARHVPVGAVPGPQGGQGAAVAAHARRRDRGAAASAAAVVIGIAVTVLGVRLLLAGLFGDQRHRARRPRRARRVHRRVVLGPAIARPVSAGSAAPAARLKGMTGTLARENATRNPKRTSATAAALMIGVALVGFITIFAASAKESISARSTGSSRPTT